MTSNPPLIAHVIHHLVVGGMENGLVNIVNQMPETAYRHTIICIEDYSDFRWRIRRSDVDVMALHRSRKGTWRMRKDLFSLMRTLRPTVVHTRGLSGLDALAPARLAGVPRTIHGEHGWDVDNLHGEQWKPRLLRRLHSPLVDHYVAVSRDIERYLIAGIRVRRDRITHICNGVDTERFSPSDTPDLSWLPASFRASNVLRVGTVGRLQKVKDQATLLRAAAEAMRRSPRARESLRLIVVGDGPMNAELRELAVSLDMADRCHFTGSRSDVAQVLSALHVFVLSSLNEGISNTILEAMATGLPVLATRVGGNPELVVDGEVGTLFEPGNVEALAALMERYEANRELCVRHGAAARRRAVEQFSLRGMVAAYQRLYDRVIGAGAPEVQRSSVRG